MYCDLALCALTFGFPNSKKNSFRGNYMRKYGTYFSLPIIKMVPYSMSKTNEKKLMKTQAWTKKNANP